MAQECGFFNAQLVGEEYDRVYLAEQFAAYFASFIGNGIFGKSMQQLEVMANNDMTTKVLSGQAWINGWWYRNTTEYNLSHSIADGVLSRIDVIVLRWDNLERDMYLHVIEGTPSAYPVKPDIVRDADYYDLQLAIVSIPAGSVRITQAQITDTRLDTSVCGLVTGVVDQIDTTDLYNQFETYFREWKEIQELDYENWTDEKKQEYNIFVQDKESEYNQWTTEKMAEYVAWIANNQADFIQWFNEMKDQLSEDAAGHLQLQIDDLKGKIDNIKLVHIFINYDTSLAGANITATNGDETYTVVASDTGLSVIDGMSLGTWTISEDEYGTSTTIQTVYYGNYNCGIGGGVFINVNFDEEFIGKVITLTNGTKTYTSIATSSLSVMFVVADYGTWTVKATVDDKEYSSSITVTQDGTYTVKLSFTKGFNYLEWLEAGRVTGTYESLDAVLEDEKALRQLFTIHASVDYLVEAMTNDTTDEFTTKILETDLVAKWVNLRDYALDSLEAVASIKTIMDSLGKYGFGEWSLTPLVPIMTSYNTPSGEVIWSDESAPYSAWKVFDGTITDYTDSWVTYSSPAYIGYNFKRNVRVTQVTIKNRPTYGGSIEDFIVQGYDGANWIDLATFHNDKTGLSEENTFKFQNDNYYSAYRLYATSTQSTYCIAQLQFSVWQPKGLVPVMTSNTAPYGEVSISSTTGAKGFEVFDNDDSNYWLAYDGSNIDVWVQYKFISPICVKRFISNMIQTVQDIQTRVSTIKILGSNDGSNFTPIHTISTSDITSNILDEKFENKNYYTYLRFVMSKIHSYGVQIRSLQFYGRTMKGLIPKMSSDTSAVGNCSAGGTYSSYSAYKAFDQNNGTYWLANTSNNWIQYAFATRVSVRKIVIRPYMADGINARLKAFKVQGSNDNFVSDIHTLVEDTFPNVSEYEYSISDNSYYKYIRVTGTSTWDNGNVGIAEIQLYDFGYSEREFAEGSTMKYIYDHGVEFENLITNTESNSNLAEKRSNYLYIDVAELSKGSSIYTRIDLSPYSLMRAICGDIMYMSGGSNFGGITISSQTPAYSADIGYLPFTSQNIPNNACVDVSQILSEYSIGLSFRSSAYKVKTSLTEWWLE